MRSDLTTRYTIGEPVHENEFVVYPATDTRTGWSVSIVAPDLGLKADRARCDRVLASIQEAQRLQQQRLVEIVDLLPPVPGDDTFYIVEKRPAKTLKEVFDEQEIVSFDRAIGVVGQLLEGAATLHGAGFAHNALTDQCVYAAEDFSGLSVRIGDLYLIARQGEPIVPPYAPEFAAPEVYRSGTVEAAAAADVYSIGIIAYKLFLPRRTYQDVFSGVFEWEMAHQREQAWQNIHSDPAIVFPRLDTLVPGFPADLATFVETMLKRDPAARPRDAVEALGSYRRFMGLGMVAPMPPQPPPGSGPTKPKRWTAGKIAVAAAVVAVWGGVAVVAVPMLLGPDPELVASVEAWRAEAESRRTQAIAAKAPERPAGDAALLAFKEGSAAFDEGNAKVTEDDYEAALPQFQSAAEDYGRTLVGIAEDDAVKAGEAAKAAGGESATAYGEATALVERARKSVAADELGAGIKSFKAAKAGFDALATDLSAVATAKARASETRDTAVRMGADQDPRFADAEMALRKAETDEKAFALKPATASFETASASMDAVIADIRAAKESAAALKAEVASLAASVATRAGPADPAFQAITPRIGEADGRFADEAYKIAIAAYGPIRDELNAIAARGFCPAAGDPAFERMDAGAYSLGQARLITSSLSELGPMLGVAGKEVRIDKPLCVQPRVVSRGEVAAFLTASAGAEEAAGYASDPAATADDVPFDTAADYAAWMTSRLGVPVRLPTAAEWLVDAARRPAPPVSETDVILEWTATPCEGGYIAFLKQAASTFGVCSDPAAGGVFRLVSEVR
ncbi:protein kinase domain-containing protein [Chthonobacter rhizosphaerae]|uniref:protein kinase domain-containing protein n=1 Tax=Chthonobacter rhizosphaerae TaxID=2735553 RepID=UPI0015EEBF26|nr:serine/threonine protein kinase [Chthonobacter rhizosphaerae]